MTKNTVLGAEKSKEKKITLKNKEHEKFITPIFQNVASGLCILKLLFVLRIVGRYQTRNVNRIYDFETGFIKPECLQEGWQTSRERKDCSYCI